MPKYKAKVQVVGEIERTVEAPDINQARRLLSFGEGAEDFEDILTTAVTDVGPIEEIEEEEDDDQDEPDSDEDEVE